MQIGIFGGTFNPIHCCHVRIAEHVQRELTLDQVLFIPTGDPPHKASTALAPGSDRLAMVQLALEEYPTFRASDVEVRSSGVSFTIDTIKKLKEEYSPDIEWAFIVGLDAFLEFPSWKQAQHLLTLCHFIVCSRPGVFFGSLSTTSGLPVVPPSHLDALDTGQSHRIDVPSRHGVSLTLLSLPPCEASASAIRKALSEGRSVSHWLPASVESYIMKHCLYQCPLQ